MAKTWVKKGNLKGPKGDLADWKRGELAPGYDIFDLYGAEKVGLWSCNLAATTSTILNLPQDLYDNPAPFVVTVKTINNGVVLQINTAGVDGDAEYVCNSSPTTGTGWTTWKKYLFHGDLPEQKPQERGYKTVPLALTLPSGASDTETVAAASLRFPARFAAPLPRWRLHVQNINDRGGQTYTGAVSFTGLWAGAGSHTTGAFAAAPVKVMDAFTTPADGSEYVGPWISATPIPAATDWLLSTGFTNTAAQQNTQSLAAVWRTTAPANASVTAPTQTKGTAAPFSIWLEAEVPSDVPVVAELGSSGAAGAGSTLPVLESALSIHARTTGALPMHYAHSGSTLDIWDEEDHHKWQKWQDYARPDAMLVSLGSNDVYSGATLAVVQASTGTVLDIARRLATPNLYATTIPPRATGDETVRRAYNTWLKTLPLGIRDVFDWSAAVSNDDETVRPEFDADGIHTNTAGAQAKAAAVVRPIVSNTVAANHARLAIVEDTAVFDGDGRLVEDVQLENGVAFAVVDRFDRIIFTPSSEGDASTGLQLPTDDWAHWGDSMTDNRALGVNAWTNKLSVLTGRSHYNGGVAGQKAAEIAARQGGLPALVTVTGNIIPASGSVTLTAIINNPVRVNLTLQVFGTLAGVPGYLQEAVEGTQTFTRTGTGLATACPPKTRFIPDDGQTNRDRAVTIWTGRNNIFDGTTAQEVVSSIRAQLDFLVPDVKRAIVISIPSGEGLPATHGTLAAFNTAIREAFPAHWLDLDAWLKTPAAATAAGITFTTDDNTDIAAGIVPRSFRVDYTHLNAAGSTAVAYRVHLEAQKRGWL